MKIETISRLTIFLSSIISLLLIPVTCHGMMKIMEKIFGFSETWGALSWLVCVVCSCFLGCFHAEASSFLHKPVAIFLVKLFGLKQ